ncbi:MAG: cell division protein FtsQ/DivIB [Gaiella sp.]
MAQRGRAGREQRPRARTASVVIPFPRSVRADRLALVRLVPSGRFLLAAFGLLAAALISVVVARETSLFAVRSLEVQGGAPWVHRQVERTLAERRGQSLVALDLDAAQRAVESLPTVAEVAFDRAYPHTLRIVVTPERPVAIVRQGKESYVVSERGRVVSKVERGVRPELARVWVDRETALSPGATIEGPLRTAVRAVTPLASGRFPARVVSVRTDADLLVIRLATGLELRLGDPADLDLKLAVAAKVIPRLRPESAYLDVSVPGRPVGGTEESQPQVEVETSVSTLP